MRHESFVESAVPSPFGEKIGATARGAIDGPVVSTVAANVRSARLPALSHVASETVYRPSATRVPASPFPFQVQPMLAPPPDTDRTLVPPVAATTAVQRTAPVVAMANRSVSRTPSPLGESSDPVADADVTAGATVSTVTA